MVCEDGYLSNKASEAASAYETDSYKKKSRKSDQSINKYAQPKLKKCTKMCKIIQKYAKLPKN